MAKAPSNTIASHFFEAKQGFSTDALISQFKSALGVASSPSPERRIRILDPQDVRVSDETFTIGSPGREVFSEPLASIHDVIFVPVRKNVGDVDAVFRLQKPSGGLTRRYGGTFQAGTDAFKKLEKSLASRRL